MNMDLKFQYIGKMHARQPVNTDIWILSSFYFHIWNRILDTMIIVLFGLHPKDMLALFASFLLSDPKVDPSYQRNDAIINAAQKGQLEVVNLLLQDHRVDPSDQDNQALRYAIKKRNVEIVKLLLASIHRAQVESCEKGNLFEILLQMDVCNCNTSVLKY